MTEAKTKVPAASLKQTNYQDQQESPLPRGDDGRHSDPKSQGQILPLRGGDNCGDPLGEGLELQNKPPAAQMSGNEPIPQNLPTTQNTQNTSPEIQAATQKQWLEYLARVITQVKERYLSNQVNPNDPQYRQYLRKKELVQQIQKMINAGYVPRRLLYYNLDWYSYGWLVWNLSFEQKLWESLVFFHRKQFGSYDQAFEQQYQVALEQMMLNHLIHSKIFDIVENLIGQGRRNQISQLTYKIDWHHFRLKWFIQRLYYFEQKLHEFMSIHKIPSLYIEHVTGRGIHSVKRSKLTPVFRQWAEWQRANRNITSYNKINKGGAFLLQHKWEFK